MKHLKQISQHVGNWRLSTDRPKERFASGWLIDFTGVGQATINALGIFKTRELLKDPSAVRNLEELLKSTHAPQF